ncbi:MAG TPA: hypothetical protein VGK73_17830, partial [Polyangiaceae bacterium]
MRFEAVTPAVAEALPRMDVAAFVGFAASGPIDVPVAVEDIADFHAIFGEDARIAWDAQRGELVSANLAPCVRAFFRNGGVRCWVVRVARRPNEPGAGPFARVNRFRLAGVQHWVPGTEELRDAFVEARSEGSWSDALSVGVSLESKSVVLHRSDREFRSLVLSTGGGDRVLPGDLVRISFRLPYSGAL